MPPAVGAYLFLLGLASGLALLAAASYRRVSPRWLRLLLMACSLLVISRYVALALFAVAQAPGEVWAWRRCWFASSIGLTVPSVFAIDQLLKHPAMSPKKLLGYVSPFLVINGFVMLFGDVTPVPDRWVGWAVRLGPGWQMLLSLVQSVFVLGFVGLCLLLMRKVPSRPIRAALGGLALAQGYLGLDGLLLAIGWWYPRPFLYSEMLALLALWHAYETSATLQQAVNSK